MKTNLLTVKWILELLTNDGYKISDNFFQDCIEPVDPENSPVNVNNSRRPDDAVFWSNQSAWETVGSDYASRYDEYRDAGKAILLYG